MKEQKHFHTMLIKVFSGKSKEEKIEYLKYLSFKQVIQHHRNYYLGIRKNKHPSLDGKCYVCGNKAHYEHHVVMLFNGGQDSPKNRIKICHSCHKLVHDWMK